MNPTPSVTTGSRVRRVLVLAILTLALAPLAAHPARAAAPDGVTLTLTPSQPSGVAAGTPITWTATSNDPRPLVYQFSVAYSALPARVVRDFSPTASFRWMPPVEGSYVVTAQAKEVSAVPGALGYGYNPTVQVAVSYSVTTPVTTMASLSATLNPLVAQYRAPSCPAGDAVVVQFRALGTTVWTPTNTLACSPPLTQAFYVAGLLPSTTYQLRHVVFNTRAVVVVSPMQTFQTGGLPTSVTFPTITVPVSPAAQSDPSAPLVDYQFTANPSSATQANPVVTNLAGQVVWYASEPDLTQVWSLRVDAGTQYLAGNDGQAPRTGGLNVLRSIDLGGIPLWETNIGAVNDQLALLGHRPIYGFHHDALPLPNGDLAVLAFTTRVITTTPMLGDAVLVLDQNLRVVWAWDAFEHLNPYRGPTLGDTCGAFPAGGFLCPVSSGPTTIDWLHANALTWSARDGDLVVSLRSQDWVIKLNYANGIGAGQVLWRLGKGGDFTLVPVTSTEPYPWFSHQHNATFVQGTTMILFDNGNTRCAAAAPGTCNSRGQELVLDEAARVVTQTLNVDLGNYSQAVGSAQRLANGNFNFDSGDQGAPPTIFGQAIEVQRDGTKVYVSQFAPALAYRAWRLQTMYSTINPPCPTCLPGHATP